MCGGQIKAIALKKKKKEKPSNGHIMFNQIVHIHNTFIVH